MQKHTYNSVQRRLLSMHRACSNSGMVAFMTCFVLFFTTSCKDSFPKDDYVRLGQFESLIVGEREALKHLSNQYSSLPESHINKLMFDYDSDPGVGTRIYRRAIWYGKTSQELSVEVDINSGPACGWKKVDQTVLDQLVVADKGLILADSLATPLQASSSICFF